jgi:hypothetical protein
MGHTMSQASTRKHPRTAFTFTTGSSGPVDVSMTFDGEVLTRYVIEGYSAGSSLTRTPSFIDENGVTVYTGAVNSDAGKVSYAPTGGVELDGNYTVRMTPGATPGTGGVDYLTLFVR